MQKKIFSNLSIFKILSLIISTALAILLIAVISTFFFEVLSRYYTLAVDRELSFYDLSIMSSFTGGAFGVIISNFVKIVRFFNDKIANVISKKGDRK